MTILHINLYLLFFYATIFYTLVKNRRAKIIFISLITLQFILINGLRHYTVGIDTVVYYWRFNELLHYDSIKDIFTVHRFEPLYTALSWLIGLFNQNYTLLLMISAIIIFIPLGRFIYQNSSNYFLSFFIFITMRFFDFSMNALRQAIAMSIILFSIKYAEEKKPFKFLGVVLVAAMFHYSAAICLPIYIIANLKPRKVYLYAVLLVVVIFTLFNGYIGQIFYLGYSWLGLAAAEIQSFSNDVSLGLTGILLIGISVVGGFLNNPFDLKTDKKLRMLFYFSIIAFLLTMSSGSSYLFKRISMYYQLFSIIYIPEMFQATNPMIKFNKKTSIKFVRLVGMTILIGGLFLYYIANIPDDYFGILPYHLFNEDFNFKIDR